MPQDRRQAPCDAARPRRGHAHQVLPQEAAHEDHGGRAQSAGGGRLPRWFKLPADTRSCGGDRRCRRSGGAPDWRGQVDALQVDLYDHEAAAPVLDSEDFYADCRALLTEDGCMTVNLFGRSSSYERSLERSRRVRRRMRSGPSSRRAKATPWCWRCATPVPSDPRGACRARANDPDSLEPAGAQVAAGVQADRGVIHHPNLTAHERMFPPFPQIPPAGRPHEGPLHWQQLVEWLARTA
jgi:hypothetical protein